jgi:hypothetical protein
MQCKQPALRRSEFPTGQANALPIPFSSNRRINAPRMSVQLAVPGWIFRTVRSVNGSGFTESVRGSVIIRLLL